MTQDLKALARELAQKALFRVNEGRITPSPDPIGVIQDAILSGMLAAVQRVEIDLLMDDFGQASGSAGKIAAELARELQK